MVSIKSSREIELISKSLQDPGRGQRNFIWSCKARSFIKRIRSSVLLMK